MKKKLQYQYLLNKEKKEIIEEFGQEFNFLPSDIWTYILKKGIFGKKTVIFLFFKEEKVFKIEIKEFYGKVTAGL